MAQLWAPPWVEHWVCLLCISRSSCPSKCYLTSTCAPLSIPLAFFSGWRYPDRFVIPHSLRFFSDVFSTDDLLFTGAYDLPLHSPSGHVSSQDGSPHGVVVFSSLRLAECYAQYMCVQVLVDARFFWIHVLRDLLLRRQDRLEGLESKCSFLLSLLGQLSSYY